jgi:hypothetical protein
MSRWNPRVEHRADIEQFGVRRQAAHLPFEGAKEDHTSGMVEQQRTLGCSYQIGGLRHERSVGDVDLCDPFGHGVLLRALRRA